LAIALVLVTGAVLFRLLQPGYVSARVAIEYGAAFFFFLAAAAFRAGILGRRVNLGSGSRTRIGWPRHGRKPQPRSSSCWPWLGHMPPSTR
jgi:hypothetical protein